MIHKYKCLNVLEFDSARKMMSVIVQDTVTKKIEVLTKGADSFVEEKLTRAERDNKDLDKCKEHILRFAETGLRTLMLAKREVPQEVYDEWALRRFAAEQSEENRQEKIDEVNAEMERDLVLVGSTAIEDRLQENVAEVIKFMRTAGIKVWVLTGDKKETAENIGVSCGLLDAE